jgi:FkbM family methyltransferase
MTIGCAMTEMGTFFYLEEDVYIAGDLRAGLAWERDVLRLVQARLPTTGPCNVVDVGAHVGTHAIPYARWVRRRGRVWAFEPQSVMADLLRRNADANGCAGEVTVLPFALGHADGARVHLDGVIRDGPNSGLPYAYEDGRPFNYGGLQVGLGGPEVVMRTLDSFALTDVALLKVDVEGAEPLVFYGARDLISRCRPMILFERNAKTITDAMRATAHVPAEASAFRIEELTSALGYSEPLHVGSDLLLLLPHPRRDMRRQP